MRVRPDVDLEIHAPPEFSWIRQATGADQVRQAVTHNFGTLRSQQPQLLTLVAQGHVIVLVGRERGEVRASGHPYDVHFVYDSRSATTKSSTYAKSRPPPAHDPSVAVARSTLAIDRLH